MGTTTSAVYSDEQMLACIDPVKNHNMSLRKRVAVETVLDFRLFGARGRLRSEFPQITYSDYVNLLNHASRYTKFPNFTIYYPLWVELVEELQSIVKEYESKQDNSDLAVHSQSSNRKPKTRSDGTGMGDDRIPFPIPVPVPSADQINKGSYQNSGEQHLKGWINNQIGSSSGYGNGSIYFTAMNDCKFLLEKGKQEAKGNQEAKGKQEANG